MNQEEKQTGQQTVINEMETTEQTVTEETVNEEATAEENVSEEETVAEETVAKETIAEETIAEEAVAEEAVAEELDSEPSATPGIMTDFRQSEAFSSLSASDQEAVGQWLDRLISQLSHHSLTADNLQSILKALHYDRDVAQAGIDGEVRGRNTRIEDMFEQRRKAADIHVLGGAAAAFSPAPPSKVLGGLSAADRQTIWERGNERRVILR